MNTLTISLPDFISVEEAKLLLAMKLFELGKVSCGKAAELSGYSKRAFMEILSKHRISIVNYPPEEIEQDVKNA